MDSILSNAPNRVARCFPSLLGSEAWSQALGGTLTTARAVAPPALEFLVQRAPGIIAVHGDAVVVDYVAVHKREDTVGAEIFWGRGERGQRDPAYERS